MTRNPRHHRAAVRGAAIKRTSIRAAVAMLAATALATLGLVTAFSAVATPLPVANGNGEGTLSVKICHRDMNVKQPYGPKAIVVDDDAVDGLGNGDHLVQHTGDVYSPTLTKKQWLDLGGWGDIIPPFAMDGTPLPNSLNWPAGQAIWNNDCQMPAPPEVTRTITICHAGDGAFVATDITGTAYNEPDAYDEINTTLDAEHALATHPDDIIKPVDGYVTGRNWPAGQATYDNGCVAPTNPPVNPQTVTKTLTICHAVDTAYTRADITGTGSSDSDAYAMISRNLDADHALATHPGDIVPPIDGFVTGRNWPAGQATYDNACVPPVTPPVTPPTAETIEPLPAETTDAEFIYTPAEPAVVEPEAATIPTAVEAGGGSSAGADIPLWVGALLLIGLIGAAGAASFLLGRAR